MTGRDRAVAHDDLLRHAERMFLARSHLDMDVLAREVWVSRATLYRIVGSRERLLGDVIWAQGHRSMRRIIATATGTGIDRLIGIAEEFNAGIIGFEPMRRFVREDPSTAFHVLFMPEAGVHLRFVALWRELIEAEAATGSIGSAMAPGDLAFVFVRIGESALYADLLGGARPDIGMASLAQRAVLQAVSG